MDLVPIKVKIGLRPNGHADHPDWHKLPLAVDVEPKTQMSNGWHYDKQCGHKESCLDSPFGIQWGMLFVTPVFAKEAKEIFPDLIVELTEVEAENFWNSKVTAHLPENKVDINILQALHIELLLKKELDSNPTTLNILKDKIAKAINPDDIEPGIRKNKQKNFADAKQVLDITLVSSE